METVGDDADGGKTNINCDICGSTDFTSEGGFYYCSVCNTQSQQTREYVEDENDLIRLQLAATRMAVLGKKTKSRKKRIVTEKFLLSSWEVLNKVIKAMTEKLIDIGFPDLLRDKVFQLWKTYLLKRDVIIRKDPTSSDTRSSCTLNEGVGNFMALYNWKTVKPRKRKSNWVPVDSEKSRKTAATKSKAKAFEASYIQSQDNDETRAVIPDAKPALNIKLTPSAEKIFKLVTPGNPLPITKPEHLKRISYVLLHQEKFTMTGVVILLFIACRQIGCRVLLSDIVRLLYDGTLYLHTIIGVQFEEDDNLPEHAGKNHLMTVLRAGLNPTALCLKVQDYLTYMGIQNFQAPQFQEFLPKFIHDSSLPFEFEALLSQLNQMFSNEEDAVDLNSVLHTPKFQFLVELKITTMIAFVLRLLFGLDDMTERHQSRFASKVNEILSKELKAPGNSVDPRSEWSELFDIKDWFGHIRYRTSFVLQERQTPMEFLHGKPPNFVRTHDMSVRYATAGSTQPPNNAVTTETILPDLVQDPLGFGEPWGGLNQDFPVAPPNIPAPTMKGLLQAAAVEANQGQIPEVADYISLPYPNRSMAEEYQQWKPNVCYPNYDSDLLCLNFQKKRIDYIYHPEKYIPILEKAGYKVKVLPGSASHYHQNELKVKSQTLLLFQPFKRSAETVETNSASLNFVIDYMSKYSDPRGKPVIRDLLESLVELYAVRSRDGLIPLVY